MYRRSLKWLLAALLTAGQFALLVHLTDADVHPHDEDCGICLLAHGAEHAVPSLFVFDFDRAPCPATVVPAQTSCLPLPFIDLKIRAPPGARA
jgi:hypothetical protein